MCASIVYADLRIADIFFPKSPSAESIRVRMFQLVPSPDAILESESDHSKLLDFRLESESKYL